MRLPQSNARLIAIHGAGPSEDWDSGGSAGALKWSGDIGAYVMEQWKTSFVVAEGGQQRYKVVNMWLPLDAEPGQQLITGDTVTFIYNGQTATRKVKDITPNVYPGHPLQTYQINLENVTVETPA